MDQVHRIKFGSAPVQTVNMHVAKTQLSMLVARSQVEGLTLLTDDPVLARYPGPIRLV